MALRGCCGDACVTVPAENRIDLSDILEVPESEHGVIGSCTVQVQLIFVQSDALDSGGEFGALNGGLRDLFSGDACLHHACTGWLN